MAIQCSCLPLGACFPCWNALNYGCLRSVNAQPPVPVLDVPLLLFHAWIRHYFGPWKLLVHVPNSGFNASKGYLGELSIACFLDSVKLNFRAITSKGGIEFSLKFNLKSFQFCFINLNLI